MKKVTARVDLEVWVDCPHCCCSQEVKEEVDEAEAWYPHRLDIPKCEVLVICENCGEDFVIAKAYF